jgi:hypothetical protein
MQQFETLMGLRPGMRVIDLGGSTKLWRNIRTPLNVTVLNLATQPIDEAHMEIISSPSCGVTRPRQSIQTTVSTWCFQTA